jgi:hypothetical protein
LGWLLHTGQEQELYKGPTMPVQVSIESDQAEAVETYLVHVDAVNRIQGVENKVNNTPKNWW